MVRLARVLAMAALVSACAIGAPAPTATNPNPTADNGPTQSAANPNPTADKSPTPVDIPTPGCDFTLLITNETAGLVRVSANRQPMGTIGPQASMYLFVDQNDAPPMPWDVVVNRVSDGLELATRHYEHAYETVYLTVTDATVASTSNNCG